MKIKITLLLILAFSFGYAQTPGLINYQGIGRGVDGAPVTNQAIGIKFEIIKGSTSGAVVFSEVQSLTTTTLGLISTQIGLVNTTLSAVNWKNGPFYLRVSVDFTGGTNYVQLGTEQQLLSVPFSMHATSVPATYSAATNELTVGGNNFTLASTPNTSLTTSGVITMTPTGTNSFALSVPQTSVTMSSTVGNSGISSSGTNSFNINVPPATTPTITGTGAAVVSPTVGNNFNVDVPQTSIVITQTGTAASVSNVGTNSFVIDVPVNPTLLGVGMASVTSVGSTYFVNVPVLTYNSSNGNLTSGSNVVNITQPMTLVGSTLTSGVNTNSVNLSAISPWRQAGTSVTLATASDKVNIGGTAAAENLQIESTTSPSVSLLASNNGTSDVMFGTVTNHAIARIRYDNALNAMSFLSPANFSFSTAGSSRMQINNIGQVVIGATSSYSTNTALTVGRPGAFNNQLFVVGGDNTNSNGGMVTLGENLSNYGVGMSMRLDAGGNRLWFTNDINGNSPVVAIGGYLGATNGMVIGTGYAGGIQAPNDGLAVQGNVGIGTNSPGTKLEVIGDITLPINNRLVFGTISSGAGIGEWIQNTSSGLQLVTASVPRLFVNTGGNIGLGTTSPTSAVHINTGVLSVGNGATNVGNIQTNGAIRMGLETGTISPNYPSGSAGLIIRRVWHWDVIAGRVVAQTDQLLFERDGTNGGFRITRTGTGTNESCHCMGVNGSGVSVNKSFTLPTGTTQIYTNAENLVFIHCQFGNQYGPLHLTEINISRYPGDFYWIGTITSTYNQ